MPQGWASLSSVSCRMGATLGNGLWSWGRSPLEAQAGMVTQGGERLLQGHVAELVRGQLTSALVCVIWSPPRAQHTVSPKVRPPAPPVPLGAPVTSA